MLRRQMTVVIAMIHKEDRIKEVKKVILISNENLLPDTYFQSVW